MESLGFIPAILFVLTLMTITILTANWVLKISKLKKDLKEQEKITTTIRIRRIENLSDKDIKELREIGNDTTDSLHFQENDFNLDEYPFNRRRNPELLNVKKMYLELAKHSRIEFVRNIIE